MYMTIHELESEIQNLRFQINADQERLNLLERELFDIKRQLNGVPVTQQSTPYITPQPQVQPTAYNAPQPTPTVHTYNAPVKKERDWEKFIGKSWMGIMASVLIFISLIMFAVVLIPSLTDEIKLTGMITVSTVFIIVGLVLHKKVGSTFYRILSACGMGALYLSILMGNLYFQLISDIPLYIFLLLWGTGIAVIAQNKVQVFSIVGNVGINIAVLLGVIKCVANEDELKFIILTSFFILSGVIFTLLNKKFDLSNTISNIISLVFLIIGYMELAPENIALFLILLCIDIIILIYASVKHVPAYFVFNTILKWIIYLLWAKFVYSSPVLNVMFNNGVYLNKYLVGFVVYVFSILSILFIQTYYSHWKTDTSLNNHAIIEGIDLVFVALSIILMNSKLFVFFVPTAFCLIAFMRKKRSLMYATVAMLACSLFTNSVMPGNIIVFVLALALMLYYHLHTDEPKTSDIIKAIASIIVRVSYFEIVTDISSRIDNPNEYIVAFIIGGFFIFDLFAKYLFSHEEEDKITLYVTYASGAVNMSLTSFMLLFVAEDISYYIYLLLGCMVFMNNVIRFVKSKKDWMQILAPLKVTSFIIIVFISLKEATILLSVALLVSAIVWILIGFKFNYKIIRLFGLISTLISMSKLLLLDIHYSHFLARAAGFFVCGLLAFLISFIYNRFEKKNS